MTNVLPQKAQRHVWGMYRARFILAGSGVACVVAILAFLALLPSYLALHADGYPESASLSAGGSTHDQADIVRARGFLSTLQPLIAATTTPSGILSSALGLRPPKVLVDHVSYTSGTLVLSGASPSRESIDTYRKSLAADPHFTSVSVPVGDLAGAQGGRFSITLSGAF